LKDSAIRALAAAALVLLVATVRAEPATVNLEFSVSIDPVGRTLRGEGTLDVVPGPDAIVVLGDRFKATAMHWRGKPLARVPERLNAWLLPASSDARKVVAQWKGTLHALDVSLDHRQTLDALAPVSGPAGTFLPSAAGWYPRVEGANERWRVTLELPAGQRGLVPGRLLEERDDARGYRARFEFPFPGDGIDLMAGPYTITERTVDLGDARVVRLRTYFAPGLEGLADGYLASSAEYIRLYDNWIGPYPFTEFSVVSSPTPTGFGLPTLTYLGADVLRLPFIRATSLGHEVLHNWWGNGVYPDYARGNWSEGLTTFMADYHYKTRESDDAGREMRLGWLRDFAAVPAGQDTPLAAFTSRTHGTSQIVGYHKAAMLFVMLRDLIGAEAFDRGVRDFWTARRFKTSSWDDLRIAFEQSSGRDLTEFFDQWTLRAGAPQVRIEAAERLEVDGRWRVRMTLAQDAPAYRMQLPVAIRSDRDRVVHTVEIDGATRTVELDSPWRPLAIELDPDLRVFRRLGPDEAPPILRDVMVNRATRAVVLSENVEFAQAARALLGRFLDEAPDFANAATVPGREPLVVIGTPDDIARYRAAAGLGEVPDPVALSTGHAVWTERVGGFTTVFISARDASGLASLSRPLPHYGKQSWLVFDGGKATGRGVWAPRPAQWRFD